MHDFERRSYSADKDKGNPPMGWWTVAEVLHGDLV